MKKKRHRMKWALAASLLLALLPGWGGGMPGATTVAVKAADDPATGKQVAIVIDDFGNNMGGTELILGLPIPLTAAVMPFMPTTERDAEMAHKAGHDVIVHMPMEPLRGKRSWLGPGAVMTDQTDEQIRDTVGKAIDSVPHAIGMNNHMGSKATSDPRVMRIVLEVCKERGLFFFDSRTNYRSVIGQIGAELGVPVVENHIFLDDIASQAHVKKQLRKIVAHLSGEERCVAIGHVGITGKNTGEALRDSIPELQKQFTFVKLATFLPNVQ
ncbi:divergent polysaccharide deacetylase family protein [Paenibacillus koleovorans]|uniref:divergent polysaccharide deacetylase family protein n=1 Tax=Paenibacillus koleovorans TaxID=121608 RepID=UPI001FEC7524|nr:divergent polysaccharide deacetylase family protein [Paenibacillus koleovorans]